MRPVLCLLTLMLASWGSTARAEMPVDAQAVADAAYEHIVALAKQTREKGTMPQWSDPAGQAALSKLWDEPAILGKPPYFAKDVPVLLAIAVKEGSVLKSYVLFSAKAGTPPDFAANSVNYQDEIARASAFMIRVIGAELPAFSDFMINLKPEQVTETRLKGVRQFRLGILQEVSGASAMVRSPELKPENRAAIIAALADSSDALAAASPPADRDAMIRTIAPALPSLTADETTEIARFDRAMKRTDCTGLCAVK